MEYCEGGQVNDRHYMDTHHISGDDVNASIHCVESQDVLCLTLVSTCFFYYYYYQIYYYYMLDLLDTIPVVLGI